MKSEFIQPKVKEKRLEELRSLQDGWFDGKGVALSSEKLDIVASHIIGKYPKTLEVPAIVLTPEGNLLLEWDLWGDPSVDIDLSTMNASFHAFSSEDSDVEEDFNLSNEKNWTTFFTFLERTINTLQP